MKNSNLRRELNYINFNTPGYSFSVASVSSSTKTIKVKLYVEPCRYNGLTLEEIAGDPAGLAISDAFDAFDENHVLTEDEAQTIADALNADFATHVWGNDATYSELETTQEKVETTVQRLTDTEKAVKVEFEIGQYDLWEAEDVLERWDNRKN